MKKLLFIVFCLCGNLGFSQTQAIRVENEEDLLIIGTHVYYLEDKTSKLTIDDILTKNQNQFQLNDNQLFNYPSTTSAYWFKFTVQNHLQKDAWLWITSNFPSYVDFYTPDSLGNYAQPYLTGTMRPDNPKLYDVVNGFWLPLNKVAETQNKTYYLRIKSDLTLEVPLKIGTIERFIQEKHQANIITAIFLGIIAMVLVHGSFLYITTKEHIYGLYLFYVIANTLATTIASYSFPFISQTFIFKYYIIIHFPVAVSTGLFCVYYLELKTNFPLLRKAMYFLFSALFIITFLNICGVNSVYLIDYFHNFGLLIYLMCLISSFYLVFKKYRPAYFYAIGWTFLIISIIVSLLSFQGILPFNTYISNSFYFGYGMEVLMFSVALIDKINLATKAKEDSQGELLIQTKENERLIREQNQTLEQKVAERTHELNTTLQTVAKQRDDIISSINYALRIQNAILPEEQELQKYFDCFVFFRPRDIVSGDFYWFANKENIKILVVADCTGHGVSGAFMTMIGNNILNQIVHDHKIYQPDKILNQMPILLQETLYHAGGTVKDGMDMTILTVENNPLNAETIVSYAGAMNPLYYIENKEFKIIKADKKPIDGRLQKDMNFFYQKHTITVQKPTTFYMLSDGYQDQFGGEKNRKFMVKKLKRLLHEISPKSLDEQKQVLSSTFDNWKNDQTQTDDVLVMGVQIG